jgi:surface polysaccharide O-acyltransferase-like enzyme
VEQKTRNLSLDALRFIAIVAVILIHTTTRTLEISHYNLNALPLSLLLNQISRFAVPLFFMISGFALEINYNSHANYLKFFKKRISKIFIPYVFWSAIYYLFIYTNHDFNFIKALYDGSSSYQLYFIPTLLIFYLLFPFIHNIYKIISNKYIFLLLGIIELLLLYEDYFVKALDINYLLKIAILNYFVFILGMVASHHQELLTKIVKKWKIILVIGTIYLAYYIFSEGKSLYLQTYNYQYFYSQWRPSIFIYTILLASLLYELFRYMNFKLVTTLSKLSFFVFFIHVIVLEKIWQLIGIHLPTINYWFDPFFFLSVTLISFMIAYLAHKIPYLSNLTG